MRNGALLSCNPYNINTILNKTVIAALHAYE